MRIKREAKCKLCKADFIKSQTTQKVCSPKCAIEYARMQRSKAERSKTRKAKDQLKTRQQWLKEAQAAFNAFIRVRDHNKPCISCGRHHSGQYHAGHYRTVGAAAHLRFNLKNCNKQCAPCNAYLSGNIIAYRPALIEKIGQPAVDWIESNNDSRTFSIQYASRVKKIFAKRTRLYKKLKGIS